MPEKDIIELLWQINRNLEVLLSKVDKLASLYEVAQKGEFERYKEEVLGRSAIRREIYGLCDGSKTVQEIAQQVGKSMPHVSVELARLEEAKLIKSTEAGRKRYYIRAI